MENCVDIEFDSSKDGASMEILDSVIGIIEIMIFFMIGFCVLTFIAILLFAILGFVVLCQGKARLEENIRRLPMEIY